MSDFCSLCGYGDINIIEIYDKYIRPNILVDIAQMSDDEFSTVGVGGICEHCGIISIGINNKYEAHGYYGEKLTHNFGHLNKETMELIILQDDPKYNEQRKKMEDEFIFLKLEMALIDLYCFKRNKIKSELSSEDWEEIFKINKEVINKI